MGQSTFTAYFTGGPLDGQLQTVCFRAAGIYPTYLYSLPGVSVVAMQQLTEARACLPERPVCYEITGRSHLGGVPEYRCQGTTF